MNKVIFAGTLAVLLAVCAVAAPTPEKPTAPFLIIPKTATWKITVKVPGQKESPKVDGNTVVSVQCWLRGTDFKSVVTYGSGRAVTTLVLGPNCIRSDSSQKSGYVQNTSVLMLNSTEEEKFLNGYTNPFSLLRWVSEATFVRSELFQKASVFVYQKSFEAPRIENSDAPPVVTRWVVMIDAATKLPVSVSMGEAQYVIENLEVDAAISNSVFDVPDNAKAAWKEVQEFDNHQNKLRDLLQRKD